MIHQTEVIFPSKRLKYAVSLRRERIDGTYHDRPYVGLEDIESATGRLIESTGKVVSAEADDSGLLSNIFEPGDVLFGKLRPYLAKAWLAEFAGRSTSELLVFEPSGIDSRFLRYVCLGRDFVTTVNASTFGSKMPRADWEFIGNIPIPMPQPQHQRAIADYLDRETEQLDALIGAKQELLRRLDEKRRALITIAVTGGLACNAEAHDSGIAWLGRIPAHWRVAGFTKYLRTLVDYRGRTPEKTRTGSFLVTARNVRNGFIDYECSEEFVDPQDRNEIMRRGEPALGEILFTTEAPLGQAALVDRVDIAIAQRVIKLDYDPTVLLNSYALQWILSAPFQYQLATLATGSTALGIKGERLHMLRNLIPPLAEQHAIIEYITQNAKRIDDLTAVTQRSVSLLKERRSSVITAAVSGRIDVPAK